MSHKKVLFMLSGSIACFKVCQTISRLVQSGFEVQTVATEAALRFIGEATLEGLTGKKVLSQIFARDEYMQHIHLGKWADVTILAPATANTLNKFAQGLGDDLPSTIFLAHDFSKPFVVVPAMNTQMYNHPVTQKSMATLKSYGVQFIEPGVGALACGDSGVGRMAEADEIFNVVRDAAPARSVHALKILISSGGTREPIDGVRSITNLSTGETGATIALELARHGHEVSLLHAKGAVAPPAGSRLTKESFVSSADLDSLLKEKLRNESFDAVIHLAAVSDFTVESIEAKNGITPASTSKKLSSDEKLTLHLKKNQKLLNALKGYSKNPLVKIVGFKLTNGATTQEIEQKVSKLFAANDVDFVVHNDLQSIGPAGEKHLAEIYSPDLKVLSRAESKVALAHQLESLLEPRSENL